MRYLFLLLVILCLSCGNRTTEHTLVLLYKFENSENISTNHKHGTIETLDKRLGKLGSSHEIRLNNKQQIEVKLNTQENIEYINSILTNPGKLEFWEVVKNEEIQDFLLVANQRLKTKDDLANPIFDLIVASNLGQRHGVFYTSVKDTGLLRQHLNTKEVKMLVPPNLRKSKFLFGLPADSIIPLYMVKTPPNGQALIDESHIIDAQQNYDVIGRPTVSLKMNPKGSIRWERMTEIAYQNYSQIAITLNDIVYSAPLVTSGAIKGGLTEISGNFTLEEAEDLSLICNSHQRIPKLKFVSSTTIND